MSFLTASLFGLCFHVNVQFLLGMFFQSCLSNCIIESISSMVAAISSLRQQVEAVQNLDQSVEILVRLVCMLPGWSEKNVQVCKGLAFSHGVH